jgi:peptidoglycan/xylan/chitin deacetylase (PgdA/CDA1 family)
MFPRLREVREGSLSVFGFHAIVAEPLPVENYCFTPVHIFRKQLEAIGSRYRVLPLADALHSLWNGQLRGKTAALTFDDGYRNNYDVALPELYRAGLPATLFLCTGPVMNGWVPWFSRLHRAVCFTTRRDVVWRGERHDLGGAVERAVFSGRAQAALKSLHPTQTEAACNELCNALEMSGGEADDERFSMLLPKQVLAMAQCGIFEFGAHTRQHYLLSRLSSDQQRVEIFGSRDDIEQLTRRRASLFAYPNGRFSDFDKSSERLVGEACFEAAFTMNAAPCRPLDERTRLPRISVGSCCWENKLTP